MKIKVGLINTGQYIITNVSTILDYHFILLNVVFSLLQNFLNEVFRMEKSLNHLSELWQGSTAMIVSHLERERGREMMNI